MCLLINLPSYSSTSNYFRHLLLSSSNLSITCYITFFSFFKLCIQSFQLFLSFSSKLQCLVNFVILAESAFCFTYFYCYFSINFLLFRYEHINFIKFLFYAQLLIRTLHSGHFKTFNVYFSLTVSPSTNRQTLQILCPQGNRIYGLEGGAISSRHIVQVLVYSQSETFLDIGHYFCPGSSSSFYINFLAYYLALSSGLPTTCMFNYFSDD